ncbi:CHC2 zinc finger domain-containing protein [Desulfitobacterium hafniense]|uniref:CHC2 zinc finger domain-containing protein n=1 Tax=Desulfitobacterium hafniense TaxID=49338 RepID=UPI00036E7886|nr:CHC2 zinc finger domain-containing protein [Desulfitobacterium hafniense]
MSNLEDIISRLDNAAFFKDHGFVAKKNTGRRAEGICPFCGEAKFNLNLEKGLWQCFGCHKSGNQITFYALRNNTTNREAVKAIKNYLGMEDDPPPEKKRRNSVSGAQSGQRKAVGVDVDPAGSADVGGPEMGGPSESDERNPHKEAAPDEVEMKHPYERLIELAHLTDEDQASLKAKRGFTDAIIDEFRFRSGGDYLRGIIMGLQREYSAERLLEVGILRNVNGTLLPEKQLLSDRILIPYLDEDGRIYHLRPHKLGLEGIPAEPYCRYLLRNRPKKVVLTEGEFKAAALYAWGIPGIGGPGTGSFGDKNFDRLVFMLQEFEVKEVCVIYDSEEKGNPEYSNFKPEIHKRFDTQYWSYMMAYKLAQAGFRTTIGWLPAEWRVDGKIDFDGALAQGRTKADVQKVINQAKTYKEFLADLDEDGQRIVKKKIAKHFNKKNIRREFNKYIATTMGPNGEMDKEISNFVINIKSNFFTQGSVVRNVQLVNTYGEVSEVFPMDSSAMAAADAFKKFVLGKGNYVFKGSGTDLTNLWEFEFLNNDGELIYMPEQIGWIDQHQAWLFGNMAIKKGKVYRPDNDGIIWVEGKGLKPQSFSAGSSEGKVVEDSIPCLSEREINIQQVAERMRHSVGGYEAYIAIGWVIATIFSKDIFSKYKCMPILFPHGKRESGKSTFMRWMMSFFGVETEGISVGKTTTANYVARALSYWSSLGIWFDEYRNEPGVVEKDGLFRSAYNRQLSGKGTATAFQAKGFSVHSVMAISGEELPKDNGLFTRCISLQISSYKRQREFYDWINKSSEYFSGLTFYLITHYDLYRDQILANIADLKGALVQRGITDRTAENWAICAAAFDTVVMQDAEFIKWVEKSCQEIKRTGEEDHMLNQFWQDINTMISTNELGSKQLKIDDKKLYVWLPGVYNEWSSYYRKRTGREPFDLQSITKYLKEEPYCKDVSFRIRIGKVPRRAAIIELSEANEIIREIADSLDEMGNNHSLTEEDTY